MEASMFAGLWGGISNTITNIISAVHRKDAAEQQQGYWDDLMDWQQWQAEHPIRNVGFSVYDNERNYYNTLIIGAVLVFALVVAIIFFGNKNTAA